MKSLRLAAILLLTVIGVVRVEVHRGGQAPAAEPAAWAAKDLRAGIIGTDTSHVPAFTAAFAAHPEWRIKVVAAFKGGSPDLPTSANRVEGFARTIQEKHGVEIVDSIEALIAKVDVVLLESVDGRPHLAQVTPVLKAGKRVFVDKPLAASLEDARRILQMSKETGTPLFSASSARFHSGLARLRADAGVGKVTKVQASYTLNPLPFHPDLYFYGIHGIEALYAVMGTGCVSVTRQIEGTADITTGKWKDGRVGVYHGLLKAGGERPPLIRIWGDKGVTESSGSEGYDGLVKAIAEFFQTGRPPVEPAQTLEVFEFMSAAQLSKERGGAEVRLAELRQ
jgi:predicted dehydrogenase